MKKGCFFEKGKAFNKPFDGGQIWNRMTLPSCTPRLAQMHLVNSSLAYIVARAGTVLKADQGLIDIF